MLQCLCCAPAPLMGLSYGKQSLCRVSARGSSNAFFFLYICGKQPHFLPCGSISSTLTSLRLTRHSLVLVPHLVRSFGAVILHVSCPNSASVLSSCYSWYLLTWNCLQLEFSDNDRFNTTENCNCNCNCKFSAKFRYCLFITSSRPTSLCPRVPRPRVPESHVLAALRPRVPRPHVPESHVPTSPSPTSPCPQVPHPRPTVSHSPKSELG